MEIYLVVYRWHPEHPNERWNVDRVVREPFPAKVRRDALRAQGFEAEVYGLISRIFP